MKNRALWSAVCSGWKQYITHRTQAAASIGHSRQETDEFSLWWAALSYSRLHPPLICSDMSLHPFPSVTSAGSHLTWRKGSKAWEPLVQWLERSSHPFPMSPCPPGAHCSGVDGFLLGMVSAPSSSDQALGSAASIVTGKWDGGKDAVKQRL